MLNVDLQLPPEQVVWREPIGVCGEEEDVERLPRAEGLRLQQIDQNKDYSGLHCIARLFFEKEKQVFFDRSQGCSFCFVDDLLWCRFFKEFFYKN